MPWQPAAVMPADVETWAVAYLEAALADREESYADGVFVSTATPNPRQARMVIVRRDGGVPLDAILDVPRLNVNVWAATDEDVVDLTRLVCALLWAAPDGDPVTKAQMVGGPVEIADAQPRRSMTFEMHTRGEALTP